jgi:type II secretory ATPase GspE/PulE/Tfp pilus assembly ATPase PilB-like protein
MLRKANLPLEKIKFFYRPPETPTEGEEMPVCDHCQGTGYYKRIGIFELLVINDKIRELIRENPNISAIKQEAVKSGMRYLYEDGLRQVIEGRTSIQELMRVSK